MGAPVDLLSRSNATASRNDVTKESPCQHHPQPALITQ
jgi:hypothetical protein